MSFFISDALAAAPAEAQPDPFMSFLPLILIFVVFYFLLIRPQTKRAKEHKKMVEGLAKGNELHALQKAFLDHGAVQCGFCTSGMLMSSKALLDENPSPDKQQIKEAIDGHICRCTGYNSIVRALTDVVKGEYKEAK